jgi:hypothetical protein
MKMISKQILSRFSAIRGDYAPNKVQDAYTSLLVVTLGLTLGLLLYGVYLFPMGGIIGVVLGFSAMIILRITQAAYTVIKYLIKGE